MVSAIFWILTALALQNTVQAFLISRPAVNIVKYSVPSSINARGRGLCYDCSLKSTNGAGTSAGGEKGRGPTDDAGGGRGAKLIRAIAQNKVVVGVRSSCSNLCSAGRLKFEIARSKTLNLVQLLVSKLLAVLKSIRAKLDSDQAKVVRFIRRPVVVKAFSSAVGYGIGDLMAQSICYQFQLARFIRMSLFGLLIHGPINYYFYTWLFGRLEGVDTNTVMKRVSGLWEWECWCVWECVCCVFVCVCVRLCVFACVH
jgi:hypothetical protein